VDHQRNEEIMRMKKLALALLATAAMILPASAGNVTIGLQEDGGTIAQAGGGSNFTLTGVSFGTFQLNNISGTTQPDLPPPGLLSSQNFNVTSDATGMLHVLNVFVTAQGLTNPLGLLDVMSSFTTNVLTSGWNVTQSTFLDAANGLFGGTLLDNQIFIGIGSSVKNAFVSTGGGPYSVTTEYSITTNGLPGTQNGTIEMSASPVPGPIVGAGLPAIMAGLTFLGLGRLRRKRS
jgi:hypothetical protein